jgi:DNA-binding transcriptional LysR family regulator
MLKNLDVPLTAIRAFVTIGRHGTFTRAAAALGITQSAVSRHVATLEKAAGIKLFERRGATIALTTAGAQYYDAVKDAVATIELATQQMFQGVNTNDRLMVRTSMPSFAMTVVVPMLGAFMVQSPLRVDLITSLSPPLLQDEFDVLITRDLAIPNTESWELLQEELVCVGAPQLVQKHRTQAPHRWPMIASTSRPDILATWAVAKDISPDRLHVGAMYDHIFLAVAAAIGGTGFLVAPQLLVLDQLRAGTLVLLDEQKIASGATYWAYMNSHTRQIQAGRNFCRWLKGMLRSRTSQLADELSKGQCNLSN